ncbi:opsin, ultraviolet-sensitive [Procambarus clarkii]|uniref:opsin, ultraviolet-sensitive n=1 Tax=Procambarus clarkii TaxID=6728 RepID=UPI001E673438|nr:opsin, ultraviolet-sensitive-like [Procambarus clarkii]
MALLDGLTLPGAGMTNDTYLIRPALFRSGEGVAAGGRYEMRMLGWNTPSEYMDYVHPYWKTFQAPNPFLHYMLAVLYIMFMFAALVGNGVVIWVFTSAKNLRTPSNMFIINLAILDFIMMLKTPVFIVNSFNEGPIWGKLGCDTFALMGSYSGVGGAVTNAAIAYDRYKTIAKPFEAKISRGTALMMVVGIWAYASPWALLPLFNIWGRFVPEGFLTTCTFDYMSEDASTRAFVGSIFVFAYIVPGSLVFYFYGQIFVHVRAHEQAMREQAKKMNVANLRSVGSHEDQEKSVEIRIAKVCMGLFFLFLISWTPYAVVALIAAFGDRSKLTPLVSMIPALTCKFVACVDPWVYAINHPRYRLELQKRMPWFCIHEEKPQDTISQSTCETEKA